MATSDPATQSHPVDMAYALGLLSEGEMEEAHGLMPWSSNYTFLVTVCFDNLEALAIYKPSQGERPLWDFPDGTLALRESRAYLTRVS